MRSAPTWTGYSASMSPYRPKPWTVACAVLSAGLTLSACTSDEPSTTAGTPEFSNPTEITNQFLPLADRGRWIYEGTRDGERYLIEVAVTPATRTVEWEGNSTETMVVRRRQLVEGLLIQEALVLYAQDDDGGVWSFGQDVKNFEEGELAGDDGSRLAGEGGVEPLLVISGDPQDGQAFSGEDVLGLDDVERHEVVSLEERVETPDGPVETGVVVATVQSGGAKNEERIFVPEIGLVLARGDEGELSLDRRLPQDAESAATETFSAPTTVDNPYFGVTGVDYRLYLGEDEGEPLRIEVALTGKTKAIEWEGGTTETVESQFIATSERDLLEIAVDWFAQDDEGNVWYFGENVWNYEEGRVANMGGTWIAGGDGPPGLIMPGEPALGQRFNPEDIPGLVFETVEVEEVDGTFTLPSGEQLTDVLVLHEVLDDASEEFKEYGPGYGNLTTDAPPVERVDIVYALPNDAVGSAVSEELGRMLAELRAISTEGAGAIDKVREALDAFTSQDDPVPDVLVELAGEQLASLDEALGSSDREEARMAALDLEHTVLDLVRLYETERPVDLDVLDLHARRMLAAVTAEDMVAASTAAALAKGVAERNATSLGSKAAEAAVAADEAAEDEDLAAIAEAASGLRAALSG
jgi:hypothetical protein